VGDSIVGVEVTDDAGEKAAVMEAKLSLREPKPGEATGPREAGDATEEGELSSSVPFLVVRAPKSMCAACGGDVVQIERAIVISAANSDAG